MMGGQGMESSFTVGGFANSSIHSGNQHRAAVSLLTCGSQLLWESQISYSAYQILTLSFKTIAKTIVIKKQQDNFVLGGHYNMRTVLKKLKYLGRLVIIDIESFQKAKNKSII